MSENIPLEILDRKRETKQLTKFYSLEIHVV